MLLESCILYSVESDQVKKKKVVAAGRPSQVFHSSDIKYCSAESSSLLYRLLALIEFSFTARILLPASDSAHIELLLLFLRHLALIFHAFHLHPVLLPILIEVSHFFLTRLHAGLLRFPLLVQDLLGLVEQPVGRQAAGVALWCFGEPTNGAGGAKVVSTACDYWIHKRLAADQAGERQLFFFF